ncbi:MAG: SMC-Scp complex subunit ScpB [Planctomycetota bacterium]|nr:SMC-Scp complex subunit ScpB [Planctomycetota bacterium]|tara:strand:- start:2278 stop:2946 length:669 start_codon:yes stop_codon:yes gene_type:complete
MADTSASASNAELDHCDLTPAQRIEAVLMTVDRPLGDRALAEAAGVDGVELAISELNDSYESTGRTFRIVRVASGWQVMTMPESAPVLSRLHAQRQQTHLTPAAMETLSIIAYRQPVMRAEIEAIRGVACGEVLRGLLERRMVRIAGRAEELGRPMLYGTTKDFLRVFGLSGIDDLPEVEGLRRKPTRRPAASDEGSDDAAASPPAEDAPPADTDASTDEGD